MATLPLPGVFGSGEQSIVFAALVKWNGNASITWKMGHLAFSSPTTHKKRRVLRMFSLPVGVGVRVSWVPFFLWVGVRRTELTGLTAVCCVKRVEINAKVQKQNALCPVSRLVWLPEGSMYACQHSANLAGKHKLKFGALCFKSHLPKNCFPKTQIKKLQV